MIDLAVWYAHHGGAPRVHRARAPKKPPRFEWRVAGKVTSQHENLNAALLYKKRPVGAELYALTPTGSVTWAEYKAQQRRIE